MPGSSSPTLKPVCCSSPLSFKRTTRRRLPAPSKEITARAGDSARLHLLIANAYHQAGELNGTISELTRSVALDPQLGPAHLAFGNAYWELNEYQYNADSLREFTEAQRLDPADLFNNYDLGSILSQYHRFADATRISSSQHKPILPLPIHGSSSA